MLILVEFIVDGEIFLRYGLLKAIGSGILFNAVGEEERLAVGIKGKELEDVLLGMIVREKESSRVKELGCIHEKYNVYRR